MLCYNTIRPTPSWARSIDKNRVVDVAAMCYYLTKLTEHIFLGSSFFGALPKIQLLRGFTNQQHHCVTLTEIDGVPSAKKLIWAKHLVGETCSWFTNRICHDKNAPSKFIAKGVIASLLSLEIRTSLVNYSSFFLVLRFSVQSCH